MRVAMWKAWSAGIALSAVTLVSLAAAQHNASPQKANPQATGAAGGDVERGKYLVNEVAMCGECHTPRNSNGDLKYDAWLQGATTWIRPVAPIQPWADTVPPLAGMPSLTDAQLATVLEKGIGPEGEDLRPPMHIYHMHHDDAKAIIAYLRSLPAGSR
jgi:mono/diheme cytochrome c family protein